MPTTPTVPLSPTTLLPALHPLDWSRRRGLSDDGFSDSLAYIALSHELCTGFTSAGRDVSYRGLGELDLSAHRAWDVAADNLVERTRTRRGVRFLTRPAHLVLGPGAPGLQVATPGHQVSAWLAHPHTFTILDTHLRDLVGGEVGYLVPTPSMLLALPLADVDTWVDVAARLVPGPALLEVAVRWAHGFPTAVSRAALMTASA